jgi:choline dehydrogenase
MSAESYDYIIVGGGTAGALLANRLSSRPEFSVLLVEAGGTDRYPWIHIPVGYLYCIDNPRTDWRFRTSAQPALNGRTLLYPRGKSLGGCSSINGMIYMRGQARDYESWADVTGDPEWRWSNVLADFMAHEDYHRLDPLAGAPVDDDGDASAFRYHGSGGEWRVERQRVRWELLDAFAEAAVQAGVPKSDDFNRGSNEGVGYFEVNQKRGWRWNTSKAFLSPVKHRPNLRIATGTQALKLMILPGDGGSLRCAGVELRGGGSSWSARATREVILAAGAVSTPKLLELSGLGSGPLLQDRGIPVLRDLPGVGANLQDHLQIRTVYKVTGAKTLNTMVHSWTGLASIAWQYVAYRSGPMSMSPSQLGVFTRSRPNMSHPNLEFHVQPLSLDAFGQPLHKFPAFTASVCNLNPSSRGSVHVSSPRPEDAPVIEPNYLSTEEDRRVAVESVQVARRIVSQSALRKFMPEELLPGPQHEDPGALLRQIGDIATTIFHPVGTARMGRAADPLAVVTPRLEVRGVAGLRIVDASVMPSIPSGNTASPTLMIAEKASRWILDGSRPYS